VKRNVLQKKSIHVDILNDERERADSVGPYGKSLLYLPARPSRSRVVAWSGECEWQVAIVSLVA
jgi:hypothetical protein